MLAAEFTYPVNTPAVCLDTPPHSIDLKRRIAHRAVVHQRHYHFETGVSAPFDFSPCVFDVRSVCADDPPQAVRLTQGYLYALCEDLSDIQDLILRLIAAEVGVDFLFDHLAPSQANHVELSIPLCVFINFQSPCVLPVHKLLAGISVSAAKPTVQNT